MSGNYYVGGDTYSARFLGGDSGATPAYRLAMLGQVVDGASAVATKVGNVNALSTAGAKIVSWYSDNLSTERAYLDAAGVFAPSGGVLSALVFGSTSASGTLTLQSTSHATKGKILLGTSAYDEVNNRLGLGTASPSQILTLNGQAAQQIYLERNTTSDTAGNTLSVVAGGATAGATNKAGGNLLLYPGVSTGSGTASTILYAYPGTAAATADNTAINVLNATASGIGMGTAAPSARLDVEYAGTTKATTDFLELTNTGNAADMDGTGTGILFRQYYYDVSTPAVVSSGRISVVARADWTSTASTQDSYMSFFTSNNGSLVERLRIDNDGDIGIGTTAMAYFVDIYQSYGTKSVAELVSITNSASAADMDGTGVGIVFRLMPNGASAGSEVSAARVAGVAETDWTTTASTQDALLQFSTTLDGSMAERWRIASTGALSNTGALGTAYLHLKAGTATASTAPLKFTDGTLLATAEEGAEELDVGTRWMTPISTQRQAVVGAGAVQYTAYQNRQLE